jgi:ABC-type antimicrobial peptide transport system permease subunit
LEACGEFLCQSIIALPITSPDNAKITDDLNKIQSCLLSTHPDNSYKIINFGEEVRRTLSRNEQLASTVAILAGFILVIVFFGLTGLLLVFLNQRQREYAISLMCGATYHQLLTESYLEIALLVIMSTLLGTLFSIPFLPLLGGMGVSVHFSVWTLIVCIIGAMLVSLVVCVLSFHKIKSITPINVLKDL